MKISIHRFLDSHKNDIWGIDIELRVILIRLYIKGFCCKVPHNTWFIVKCNKKECEDNRWIILRANNSKKTWLLSLLGIIFAIIWVIVTDKAPSIASAFRKLQKQGLYSETEHRTVKYLNNLIDQDHRPVKRRNKLYQSLRTASTTIKGIEALRGIYKKNRRNGTLFGFSVSTEIKVFWVQRGLVWFSNFATEPKFVIQNIL